MLIVVQINIMFLTDLAWWQCSLNFAIVWTLHLINLERIEGSKLALNNIVNSDSSIEWNRILSGVRLAFLPDTVL